MTLEEAIEARHSVRAYKEQPLAENVVKVLEEKIAVLNREGKLHIQLIQNEPKAFLGTMAKYGKFRNVGNYIVMAGQKADDLDERVGYYGEQLVLLAQTLGLNTCWVGLSYSKVPGTYELSEDEKIACYMPVVTSQYWNIAYGLAPGEATQDTEGMQTMRTLANNMAWLLKKIHANGTPDYPEREEWQGMNFIR